MIRVKEKASRSLSHSMSDSDRQDNAVKGAKENLTVTSK